jgi:hypothetical protein
MDSRTTNAIANSIRLRAEVNATIARFVATEIETGLLFCRLAAERREEPRGNKSSCRCLGARASGVFVFRDDRNRMHVGDRLAGVDLVSMEAVSKFEAGRGQPGAHCLGLYGLIDSEQWMQV